MNYKTKKNQLGFTEISNKPSLLELEKYYEQKYYQQGLGSYEVEYSKNELLYIKNKIKQKGYILSKFIQLDGKKLLDVGCGEGFVLQHFKDLGCNVKGIDFSSDGINRHNPSVAKYFKKGNIFDLLENEFRLNQTYDIVWLQNVLEHVIDPLDLMSSLKRLVSKLGILVVTIPNDFSKIQDYLYKSDLVNSKYWVAPPDHLSYFNSENIKKVLKKTGWHLCDLTGDFPIEWFLVNEHSNYINNKMKGKAAHMARIEVENLISESDPEKVLEFWRALANLGMTRNITLFLKNAV